MDSIYPGLRLCHQWANVISKTILDTVGCKGVLLVCDKMRKIRQWIFYETDFIQFKGKPFILDCCPSDLMKVWISPFFMMVRGTFLLEK